MPRTVRKTTEQFPMQIQLGSTNIYSLYVLTLTHKVQNQLLIYVQMLTLFHFVWYFNQCNRKFIVNFPQAELNLAFAYPLTQMLVRKN